ncbi:hypothetical protein Tco_1082962 [Tanacetum coccineum]|uniref:Uncharacterized protein n=1 Tax=Tanacetum coccineum TaxID=301880 RepID=A0ABQ5I451_9ASTR
MSTLTFADTHNMVAFLEKPAESDGFHEIIDFLNANQIRYALTVNPTIYTSCIQQVKKLEQTINTSQARRRAKVVISDDEEAEEDPSNQGRSLIEELDLNVGISLVPHCCRSGERIVDSQIRIKPGRAVSELDSTAGVKEKDKGKAIMHETELPKKIKKSLGIAKAVGYKERSCSKSDHANDIDWSDPSYSKISIPFKLGPFSVVK